jgi:hypothetical protein
MKTTVKKATTAEVCKWFKENDLNLWLTKTKVSDARRMASIELGKINSEDWTKAKNTCVWYRQKSRRSRKSRRLNIYQWELLRAAVEATKEFLRNKTIEQAALIVSTRYACNPHLLEGLSSDLHFWVKPAKPLTEKPSWLA